MAITSKISDDQREVTIKVDGRFDFNQHKAFREAYSRLDPERARYQIDLSSTEYIDSSALGMLLLLRERAGGDRSRISIRGCCAEVCHVLEVSRFQDLFDIQAGG